MTDDRSRSLQELRILGTPAEPAFDSLVALAAGRFDAAIAVAAFLDGDRQWFKARVGLAAEELPAAGSIARAAMDANTAIVVPDMSHDTRFASDAILREHPARFCAAAPIRTAAGVAIGALVVLDGAPRAASPAAARDIETLATLVAKELERRCRQFSDTLVEGSYRGLLELSSNAIIVIDEAGTIHATNPATEQMFGHPHDRLIGRNISALMPPSHRSAHPGYLERYRATGERRVIGFRREVEGCRADGSTFPMVLRVVEWRDASGARFFTGMARDISEQKAAERALIEARNEATKAWERLEDAIDALPEGFALFDAEDRLVAVNERVRTLYSGIAVDLLEGAQYEHLLRTAVSQGLFKLPPDTDREAWIADRLTYHRAPDGVEEIELADGRWVRFQERVTREGGRVGLRLDITATKQREAVLRHSIEAAEASNLSKTQFLATMSHELRTPLNAIIGFSQLMLAGLAGEISESNAVYLRLIAESGEHLIKIINEVLDLARLDTGHLTLSTQVLDIRRILSAVLSQARQTARANNVTLGLDAPEALPSLRGDPLRLQQAFASLVANGIKFAPNGHVTVTVSPDVRDRLTVVVADTGIGMRPEDVAVALEPFSQLDAGLDRKFEGCGIGLSLASRLIALHDGQIVINSTPGHGTRVQVRLPVETQAAAPANDGA